MKEKIENAKEILEMLFDTMLLDFALCIFFTGFLIGFLVAR